MFKKTRTKEIVNYDERKGYIKFNIKTRQKVEDILNQMREKLEELKNE